MGHGDRRSGSRCRWAPRVRPDLHGRYLSCRRSAKTPLRTSRSIRRSRLRRRTDRAPALRRRYVQAVDRLARSVRRREQRHLARPCSSPKATSRPCPTSPLSTLTTCLLGSESGSVTAKSATYAGHRAGPSRARRRDRGFQRGRQSSICWSSTAKNVPSSLFVNHGPLGAPTVPRRVWATSCGWSWSNGAVNPARHRRFNFRENRQPLSRPKPSPSAAGTHPASWVFPTLGLGQADVAQVRVKWPQTGWSAPFQVFANTHVVLEPRSRQPAHVARHRLVSQPHAALPQT